MTLQRKVNEEIQKSFSFTVGNASHLLKEVRVCGVGKREHWKLSLSNTELVSVSMTKEPCTS